MLVLVCNVWCVCVFCVFCVLSVCKKCPAREFISMTVLTISKKFNRIKLQSVLFAVFLLCVLRATFVHARTRQWAVRTYG